MTTIYASKRDFDEWMRNPVTKIIRGWMDADRAECICKIGDDHEMAQKDYSRMAIKWAAMVNIYDCWLNISYKTMQDTGNAVEETMEDDDEKS